MSDDHNQQHYDEKAFHEKVLSFAGRAGREIIVKALVLYYTVGSERCPAWAKAVIFGALGYFILPVDAVPDLIPGVGLVDDLGALAAASAAVAAHIGQEEVKKAEEQADRIFG